MSQTIQTGDLAINFLKSDEETINGLPNVVLPGSSYQTTDVILNDLTNRLNNVENMIEFKVDSGQVVSKIRLSEEALLIQSDKVAVLGQVTFADYIRDQNGTVVGGIDPKITQIIGDKIRTGSIESINWSTTDGSKFDLDNGELTIGGSTDPKLHFDLATATLTINGTLDVDSIVGTTTLGDIWGDSSLALANVLDPNYLSDTLEDAAVSIKTQSTNFIEIGTTPSMNGLYLGSAGLYGKSGGFTSFSIDSSGNATFAGALSAATGTFTGSLAAATGTFAGILSSAKQVKAVTNVDDTSTGYAGYFRNTGISSSSMKSGVYGEGATTGVYGKAIAGNGVYGISASGRGVYGSGSTSGVYGTASLSSGAGVYAVNSGGGPALYAANYATFNSYATFNGNVTPSTTNTRDLGTSSLNWNAVYARYGRFSSDCNPDVNLGANLGASGNKWASAYINRLFRAYSTSGRLKAVATGTTDEYYYEFK